MTDSELDVCRGWKKKWEDIFQIGGNLVWKGFDLIILEMRKYDLNLVVVGVGVTNMTTTTTTCIQNKTRKKIQSCASPFLWTIYGFCPCCSWWFILRLLLRSSFRPSLGCTCQWSCRPPPSRLQKRWRHKHSTGGMHAMGGRLGIQTYNIKVLINVSIWKCRLCSLYALTSHGILRRRLLVINSKLKSTTTRSVWGRGKSTYQQKSRSFDQLEEIL